MAAAESGSTHRDTGAAIRRMCGPARPTAELGGDEWHARSTLVPGVGHDELARAHVGQGVSRQREGLGFAERTEDGDDSVTAQPTVDEDDIRQRIGMLAQSIATLDLEGVMSHYAPDIVSFDVEPPLRQVGAAGKRKNWVEAFAVFQPPLDYEIRDLTITVSGDVAFAYSINRLSGTLSNGTRGGVWVRVTMCFRRDDGRWLIAHDHASVPLDFASGKAVLNLEP
jgi:ketosteroid isomerase-like protein